MKLSQHYSLSVMHTLHKRRADSGSPNFVTWWCKVMRWAKILLGENMQPKRSRAPLLLLMKPCICPWQLRPLLGTKMLQPWHLGLELMLVSLQRHSLSGQPTLDNWSEFHLQVNRYSNKVHIRYTGANGILYKWHIIHLLCRVTNHPKPNTKNTR